MIKISKVSLSEERRIIENLLFSKKLLADVVDIIKPEYFRNEKYIKIVKFIMNYYDEYEDAPKEHIQDFILALKEDQRDYYIDILNPMIERNQSSSTNDQYFFEQTLKFFKKRELEIISDNVKYLINKDDIQSAEQELLKYNEPTRLTTQFFNPFDDVQEVFNYKEDGLFRFTHGLDELLGPMNRGWFVAVAGGFKRGKSHLLMEFFISAMMNRLKVVFFSLEMQKVDMKNRLYKRVLSLADTAGLYRIPIFDCLKNQNGKCTYPTRVGSGLLFDKSGKIPNPRVARNHKICTACMGSDDFEPSSWYEDIPKDEYDASTVTGRMTGFKNIFEQYVQMRCFPRFSASVKDIRHEVDILINKLNFLPDVIIVDFADIIRPDSNVQGFEKEDLVWMELAQLASTLNCLVVTATQLTRDGLDTENVEEKHLSKWIGKLSHVDVMMALNQTDEEKAKNIMRVTMLDHRHKEFNKLDTCYLLQDLAIGQANLGSYLKRFK